MTTTDTNTNAPPKRRTGRPRRGSPPSFPREEVDKLLVFGEAVTTSDGGTTIKYPSYRELAERYNCAHSLIAEFAKRQNCRRRREEAKARTTAKADQKLVELRAETLALSRDDELKIVDGCLARFEKALADGQVQLSSAGDLNTLLRLKEFLHGGADSRQEVHTTQSLEAIQARHRQQIRATQETTSAERGEVPELDAGGATEDTDESVQ